MSDFLRAGPPSAEAAARTSPALPPISSGPVGKGAGGNPWLSVLAGVGVLLLAMGVGVLIGRAGNSGGKAAPAQVITVGSSGGSAQASGGSGEEAFTDDWPSATKGFTVQLQTLPEGTTVAAVGLAKSAATAKGATAVGALKEADYSSFSGSGYVVYSGVYTKKAEAQKALASVKSRFSGAKVVEVSKSAGSKASESSGESTAPGSNLNHAAPPSVLKSLSHAKGKSYEEKSKNLPDVVETG